MDWHFSHYLTFFLCNLTLSMQMNKTTVFTEFKLKFITGALTPFTRSSCSWNQKVHEVYLEVKVHFCSEQTLFLKH